MSQEAVLDPISPFPQISTVSGNRNIPNVYWRKAPHEADPGWIIVGPGEETRQADRWKAKGRQALPQYSMTDRVSPKTGKREPIEYSEDKMNRFRYYWFFKNGGAKEFTVEQIVAHNWVRPPYGLTIEAFPQLNDYVLPEPLWCHVCPPSAPNKNSPAQLIQQLRENYRNGIQRIPLAIHRLDVPTIAAVNGPASGAGCDLTCMCDIRVASEKARFGETFAALGLIPGDGGTFFLPRVIGLSRTCELVFTCRTIDAAEALRIGLVSEVTTPERLIDRCLDLAREIARQPAITLRMAKRLLTLSQGKTLEEVLELSAAFQAVCHHTPEHAMALDAFLARQKPA